MYKNSFIMALQALYTYLDAPLDPYSTLYALRIPSYCFLSARTLSYR